MNSEDRLNLLNDLEPHVIHMKEINLDDTTNNTAEIMSNSASIIQQWDAITSANIVEVSGRKRTNIQINGIYYKQNNIHEGRFWYKQQQSDRHIRWCPELQEWIMDKKPLNNRTACSARVKEDTHAIEKITKAWSVADINNGKWVEDKNVKITAYTGPRVQVDDRVMTQIEVGKAWRAGTITKRDEQANQTEILIDNWTNPRPFTVFKPLSYEPGTYKPTNNTISRKDSKNEDSIQKDEPVTLTQITYDDRHMRWKGLTDTNVWVTIENEKTGTCFLQYQKHMPKSWCDCFLNWYMIIAILLIVAYTAFNIFEMVNSGYGFQCDKFWPCWGVYQVGFGLEYVLLLIKAKIASM